MDAVMFHAKAAHLAAQRIGRWMLRRFGITPARFDLMHALGHNGLRQSTLWRRLNVVRSVVCEMVRALEALGWVERERDAHDRRTWVVKLTGRGRAVFELAYADQIESGQATMCMDEAISRGQVECNALTHRTTFIQTCLALVSTFRTGPPFRGSDLYPWDPEDFYFWFVEVGDGPTDDGVPFVS